MKLALFSPLAPEHTEIANHTARLRAELERRFEVRFFTEQPGGFLEPAAGQLYPARLGEAPTELLLLLNTWADVPLYNLGNHPGFFAKTWFLSQSKPGLVALHDLKLHHFFEGIYRERLEDQRAYLGWMAEHYGEAGRDAGMAYWAGKLPIGFMAENFPMMVWAVRNALGLVVHTPHALDAVRRETGVPARLAPLPYEPRPQTETPRREPDPPGGYSPASPARLIIFGFLNANRRVGEFLRALAAMPERACFRFDIYGTVLHLAEVEAAVRGLDLTRQVAFHGYVSDEALDDALARADLAVNLRYPTMGEASASQLRIWDHALPSLVTRSEGYADLPPEAVHFVRPEHEQEDIQSHLRRFLSQPEEFRQSGLRGREFLRAHHRPAAYADALADLCGALPELRRRHSRLAQADRVGQAAAPWLNAAPSSRLATDYAAAIAGVL